MGGNDTECPLVATRRVDSTSYAE